MNATSFVRPLCWLLGAPLMLIVFAAAVPSDADGADPVAAPVAPIVRNAPAKKSVRDQTNGQDKNKSSLGKNTKKKQKHHKNKKHQKKGKKGNNAKNGQKNGQKNGRTSAKSEVARDEARIARDEATLTRDTNQLKRALR